MRNRAFAFAALCLVCLLGLAGYFYWARHRAGAFRTAASGAGSTSPPPTLAGPLSTPLILFRYNALDDNYGKLAAVDRADLQALRFLDRPACEVVNFAGGRGVCLSANRGVLTTYAAHIFDQDRTTLFTIPVHGEPSRCRVSPDGRLAAFTVFVSGHSYTSLDFSTETMLVDTATGSALGNVEKFEVTRDGHQFKAADFNFWGVSFTPDSKRFYCTLSTNRKQYLVEGDIASKRASVVRENAECPSVSPDGSRVAYKKRFLVNDRVVWQLQVLDLATMKETPLRETRSVDDQLEWLDNEHVLYAVSANPTGSSASTDVWSAEANGTASPQLFLRHAYSPTVVR